MTMAQLLKTPTTRRLLLGYFEILVTSTSHQNIAFLNVVASLSYVIVGPFASVIVATLARNGHFFAVPL